MKKISLLLLVILCGCRSVTYQDVNPVIQPNANLLPAMTVEIDEKSLHAAYPTQVYSEYNERNDEVYSLSSSDRRVGDVRNIFEKEVNENITNPYGAKKGYLTLKLGFYNGDYSQWYIIPSVFTVFTINMVGFPMADSQQTLEVIVEVKNNNHELIKRYKEVVTNRDYVAMYWGYSQSEILRKVGADNIKQALERIRYRINADAPEIKRKLN